MSKVNCAVLGRGPVKTKRRIKMSAQTSSTPINNGRTVDQRCRWPAIVGTNWSPIICLMIVTTYLALTPTSQWGIAVTLAASTNEEQGTTSLPHVPTLIKQEHSSKPRSIKEGAAAAGNILVSGPEVGAVGALRVRALAVSSRGALAFTVRNTGASARAYSLGLQRQLPPTPSTSSSSQPQSTLECPDPRSFITTTTSSNPFLHQNPVDNLELLAVEGSSVKLNMAIVLQRARVSDRSSQQQSNHHQQGPPSPIRLQWRRSDELIEGLNTPRGRFASVQLASESEPEAISHLLGLEANQSSSSSISSHLLVANRQSEDEEQQTSDSAREKFHLFPHVNEQQLGQLERNSRHLPTSTRAAISAALRAHQQERKVGPLAKANSVDRFLANGQLIDWRRLGAFLQQHDETLASSSCLQLESVVLLQFEIEQLRLSDRGDYQLFACNLPQAQPSVSSSKPLPAQPTVQSSGSNCLQRQLIASISVQTIEDVPRLESWFEPQLLEPGSRMSIKCEATGFTLPQISWFLDGQLLSESPARSGELSSSSEQLSTGDSAFMMMAQRGHTGLASTSHQFRVGDYVSQDNHVHSFVNSSSVRLADGGFYKCQANNGLHQVEHEARIDVRGPATIQRPLEANVSALIGSAQVQIQCPYSGHPVGPIEWFFKPSLRHPQAAHLAAADEHSLDSSFNSRSLRKKRRQHDHELDNDPEPAPESVSMMARVPKRKFASKLVMRDDFGQDALDDEELESLLADSAADEDDPNGRPLDPDRDEWLSQANAMTQGPNEPPPELPDYPAPLPDYPVPVMNPSASRRGRGSEFEPADQLDADEAAAAAAADEQDYSDIPMSFQQASRANSQSRQRRAVVGEQSDMQQQWIKLPQSRRHQVHANGTLTLHDVQLADHGQYKCHVQSSPAGSSTQLLEAGNSILANGGYQTASQILGASSSWSNELYLNTLVAPVISPFSSSDTLREGMRNFLSCAVIEGDAPVRLSWLKDGRPIDEHIELTGHLQQPQASAAASSSGRQLAASGPPTRIKVEAGNEFTSTLSFAHVDFRDNGNYTCIASNKAASVNYTAKMVVNVPPKWTKTPRDLDCVAGQNIVIDCQAEAHPQPRIWWEVGSSSSSASTGSARASEISGGSRAQADERSLAATTTSGAHSSTAVAPNHYRTIISNSRIHILENASLVIRDVGKQDQGFYLCQAANNFGSLSALIKLTVNVGASFHGKYLVKYVKLNDHIELDCDPGGQSPITVTWFARSQQLGAGAQLVTPPPTTTIGNQLNQTHHFLAPVASLGNQSSSAPDVNKLEATRRRLFSATIQTIEPVPGGRHQTSDEQLQLKHQQQQQANIEVEASKPIELDSSTAAEILKLRHGGELVRLHIRQARRSHSGEFICQAANQFGQDEKSIKLLVQEPPEVVREIGAVQVDSRSVSLAWQAPFNGNAPITSYVVEWAPIDSSIGSSSSGQQQELPAARQWQRAMAQQPALTISSLQPTTTYEIRVFAQNALGRSPAAGSAQFVVSTSEEAPSSPPSDIKALPMSSSSIQVSWLPPATLPLHSPFAVGTGEIEAASRDELAQFQGRNVNSNIKGYYLGYKLHNTNESYIFKTVPVFMGAASHFQHHRQQQQSNGHDLVLSSNLYEQAYESKMMSSHSSLIGHKSHNGTRWLEDPRRLRVLIGDLRRHTKYSIIVQAFNSAGSGPQSDPIEARTLLNDPPQAPALRVGMATFNSIELQWSFSTTTIDRASSNLASDDLTENERLEDSSQMARFEGLQGGGVEQATSNSKEPSQIDGYLLYFRSASGEHQGNWMERRLDPNSYSIVATGQLHQASGGEPKDLTIVDSSRLEKVSDRINTKAASDSAEQELVKVERKPSRYGETISWPKVHGVNASLATKNFRFVLEQLECGNFYQIYLTAYNSHGVGLPSQIVRAKTRGSAPIPPRKQQDFIQVNKTSAQLNLLSWLDAGCSLSNFEIRYKQLHGRQDAINMLQTINLQQQQQQHQQPKNIRAEEASWEKLPGRFNHEKHFVELSNLQPESWYGLWVTAKSSAGDTDAFYGFMTLDKMGQVPSEALEPLPVPSGGLQAPALFRSPSSPGSAIRSILYSLSGSGGANNMPVSPLIISACMCIILFATCSLFLIKRYNNMIKDDQSMEFPHHRHSHNNHSQQQRQYNSTAANPFNGSSSSSSESPPLLDASQQNHHANYELASNNPLGIAPSPHPNTQQEYYSMKVSPCKTGTTIITNGSSSTNGSSALLLGGSTHNNGSICDSSALTYAGSTLGTNDTHQTLLHRDPNVDPSVNQTLQHRPQFAPCTQLNCPAKFATLARETGQAFHNDQQQSMNLINSCNQAQFKTLPHNQNSRPMSTFLPPNNTLNSACLHLASNRYSCNGSDYQQQQQQQLADQQQIYSKLRLLQHYNAAVAAASNYNLSVCQQDTSSRLADESNLINQAFTNQQTSDLNTLMQQQQQPQQQQHQQTTLETPNTQQSSQQQSSLTTNNPTNEQDDYALPFPPRWV